MNAITHGPTGMPKHTLGKAAAKWASTYLQQPDRDIAGIPWQFTREQLHFLAWWYAIDEHGQFLYTYGVLRRMKGWGKDPLAAVISAIEFIGPCRFGGWEDGEPIAVPQPSAWVQVAAVSKEQTRNTMTLLPALFSRQAIAEYNVSPGKELWYAHNGRCQLQAVTTAPATLEGARSSFVVLNETQHWMETNDGHEMARAIRRNSAKIGGRGLAITNAHRIGEVSVAEQDWERYLREGDVGSILYDSLEAPEDTVIEDDESLRRGLMSARGDSVWVPIDRLMVEARDETDTEVYRRRYYLNQIRQETSTWITAADWKATEREEAVPSGAMITLGFDGSRHWDTTALVATRIKTGYQWVIKSWTRPEFVKEWEVPAAEVTAAVDAAFEMYSVWRLYADPSKWDETIAKWAGRHGDDKVVEFLNEHIRRLTRSLRSYESASRTGELGHEKNLLFAEHVANVVKEEVNVKDEDGDLLYKIRKESKNSKRKIDIAMAAVLSWAARIDALEAGVGEDSVYESRGVLVLG